MPLKNASVWDSWPHAVVSLAVNTKHDLILPSLYFLYKFIKNISTEHVLILPAALNTFYRLDLWFKFYFVFTVLKLVQT